MALAFLAGMVAALAPADARAFCREVNAPPPAGYDPAVSGCFYPATNGKGGRVVELYWKNLCVGYSVQQDASRQLPLDQATTIAARAFAAWTGAACSGGGSASITAVDEGPVACGMVRYNEAGANQNVIVFRDDGWPYQDSSNVLGLTTLTVSNSTGEIFDSDMEINSHDFVFGTGATLDGGADAATDTFDILGIMTHEAGHFLGLAHATDMTATMYAGYSPATAALADDDVAGICSIDLPGGSRSTSLGVVDATACDPMPKNGFSTECNAPPVDAGTAAASKALACPPIAGCTTTPRPWAAPSTFALLGIAAFGALARRRFRRLKGASAAVVICLSAFGATAATPGEARASVSIAVLLDELVSAASAAAVVTPVEQHAQWENGRIFTYTRVVVDDLIAGRAPGELSVRTMGGSVGDIGQIVEGEASLTIGEPCLLFLRSVVDPAGRAQSDDYVVAARAQGQFAIVFEGAKKARLSAANAGALIAPSLARIARVLPSLSAQGAARLAREALHRRAVEDAVRDIVFLWGKYHGSNN